MQEQELVKAMIGGDRDAFELLIREYQQQVYAYLRIRLLDPTDAEDLTQEVFLRFYLVRAKFDSRQLVRPWLLGIARNILREFLRSRRQRDTAWTKLCLDLEERLLPALRVGPPHNWDRYFDKLRTCIDGLGQSARQAIDLHYSDDLQFKAIAEKLHRSEGAVKLLVFRARQAVKRCLDEYARVSKPPDEGSPTAG